MTYFLPGGWTVHDLFKFKPVFAVRRITEIPKYHRNTEIPLFLGYLIQISDKYAP